MNNNYYFLNEIIKFYDENLSFNKLIWENKKLRYLRNGTYFLAVISLLTLPMKSFIMLVLKDKSWIVFSVAAICFCISIVLAFLMYSLIRKHLNSTCKINIVKGSWNDNELYKYRVRTFKRFLDEEQIDESKFIIVSRELDEFLKQEEPDTVLGIRTVSAFLIVVSGAFLNRLFELTEKIDDLLQTFIGVVIFSILILLLIRKFVIGRNSVAHLFFRKYYDLEDMRKLLVSTKFISSPKLD